MKTAHAWAIELTHERIAYGSLLEEKFPEVVPMLKQAIFRAAKDLIQEVQADAQYPAPPPDPIPGEHEPGDVPAPSARGDV